MQLSENTAIDIKTLKPDKSISSCWYTRFMKRQPHLTLRRYNPIESVNPRILPLTIKYECLQLASLIINLVQETNEIGPKFYSVIPC